MFFMFYFLSGKASALSLKFQQYFYPAGAFNPVKIFCGSSQTGQLIRQGRPMPPVSLKFAAYVAMHVPIGGPAVISA